VETFQLHPQGEVLAWSPRHAHLEQYRSDAPPLTDQRTCDLDAANAEVLAEQSGRHLTLQGVGPPERVLLGIGVHRLVRAPVRGVNRAIARQAELVHPDRTGHRSLVDRGVMEEPGPQCVHDVD